MFLHNKQATSSFLTMSKIPCHTITLQDGTLFNFKRRLKKQSHSLLQRLDKIPDHRQARGKRHCLTSIFFMIFTAMLAQYSNLSSSCEYGRKHHKWLRKYVPLPHGIPHETTVSRFLSECDLPSVSTAWLSWMDLLFPESSSSASFDGKTMRGVHGEEVLRHILSVFTHQTKQTLGQEAVTNKENEIPAAQRLLPRLEIKGLTLVADALHTQKETITSILEASADYLVFTKGNQKNITELLEFNFADPHLDQETDSSTEHTKSRSITTTVSISQDVDLEDIRLDWVGINWIGKVHRKGTRTHGGREQQVNETVYFICSQAELTAKGAARMIRDHWGIENNLHWQKDWTFHEDQQTLRNGVAPAVMTLLRSVCISICHSLKLKSVTKTLRELQMDPVIHHHFVRAIGGI